MGLKQVLQYALRASSCSLADCSAKDCLWQVYSLEILAVNSLIYCSRCLFLWAPNLISSHPMVHLCTCHTVMGSVSGIVLRRKYSDKEAVILGNKSWSDRSVAFNRQAFGLPVPQPSSIVNDTGHGRTTTEYLCGLRSLFWGRAVTQKDSPDENDDYVELNNRYSL